MIRRDLKRFFNTGMIVVNASPREHVKMRYVVDSAERRAVKRSGPVGDNEELTTNKKQARSPEPGNSTVVAETFSVNNSRNYADALEGKHGVQRLRDVDHRTKINRAKKLNDALSVLDSSSDHYKDTKSLLEKETDVSRKLSACSLTND